MFGFLFIILDILFVILFLLLALTQIVLPLFTGLPLFWLFFKEGRDRFNFVVSSYLAQVEKESNKSNKKTK